MSKKSNITRVFHYYSYYYEIHIVNFSYSENLTVQKLDNYHLIINIVTLLNNELSEDITHNIHNNN